MKLAIKQNLDLAKDYITKSEKLWDGEIIFVFFIDFRYNPHKIYE